MASVPVPVFLVAVAVPLCGLAWMASEQSELHDRIARLETPRVAAAPEETDGGTDAPSLGGSPAWKLAVRDLESRLGALRTQVDEAAAAREIASAGAEAGGVDAEDPVFEGAVRSVVMDLADDVRFRTRLGLSGSPGLPKKPSFHRLAEVLELDAVQEEKLRAELVEMKQSFFSLLGEERVDGIVPLERMAEADGLPESDPRRAKLFIEVLSLRIPGGEETYLERMMDRIGGMRTRVREHLRPQQAEIWDHLDVDWMGIEVE